MNRLLKNVDGQRVPFAFNSADGLPLTGASPVASVKVDDAGLTAGAGTVFEIGNGLYEYKPTQAETNGDSVSFVFYHSTLSAPSVVESFRPEVSISIGDVTLAAVQPHYAPAKAGDAMAILEDQDVRNILGGVAGDVSGNILGTVPSPATLSEGAVDAILDQADGVLAGMTVRQALAQLVAALVDVSVSFATAQHMGPTQLPIRPLYATPIREKLFNASAALQKVVQLNEQDADVTFLSTALATACKQLAVALDAVRTSTA